MLSAGDIQALIAANWQGKNPRDVPVLSIDGTGQTISYGGKSVTVQLTRADVNMASTDFVTHRLASLLNDLRKKVG